MPALTSLLCGLVFGLGLLVSGLVNPAKVKGFLDIAGPWDPSLAFVMGGAVAVGLIAFHFADRRARSVLGLSMPEAPRRTFDRRSIFGSLVFGVGWGIAGFCPGPALVALGSGQTRAAVFVAAMLGGMALYEWIERRRAGHRA